MREVNILGFFTNSLFLGVDDAIKGDLRFVESWLHDTNYEWFYSMSKVTKFTIPPMVTE